MSGEEGEKDKEEQLKPQSSLDNLRVLRGGGANPPMSSAESVLLKALDLVRKGELTFVLVTGRDVKTGGIHVMFSEPIDEIQAIGCLELTKAVVLGRTKTTR